jgi:cytochrome c-type biogenesis protein
VSENPTFLAAFAAGLLSFISPCVLPLIPGYLSYISGLTLDEMQGVAGTGVNPAQARGRVLLASVFFVLGFSCVFIAFGAAASALGSFLLERQRLLAKVAAVIVILFGLHTMGVLRIGWLYSEKRVQVEKKPTNVFGAFFVGLAFAFGWTPCIGPILAGILAIAGVQDTVGQGVRLLAVYSLGLGIPFLIAALGFRGAVGRFPALRRRFRLFELAGGGMLVVIGLLLVTGLWDSLLNQLRVWAGSVNLPL